MPDRAPNPENDILSRAQRELEEANKQLDLAHQRVVALMDGIGGSRAPADAMLQATRDGIERLLGDGQQRVRELLEQGKYQEAEALLDYATACIRSGIKFLYD